MMNASGSNRQANRVAGAGELTDDAAKQFTTQLKKLYEDTEHLYQFGLKHGVPKELARVILPVGRYSRMRASANLLNWMRFLTLRDHPKAQWEIREFAKAVAAMLEHRFPRTLALFAEDKIR